MIPAAFVLLNALPLTPTGKVDRRALPAPEKVSAPNGAPLTETEEKLAGVWSELLKRGQPAATDNFFEIGGQSLIATRMLSRVREVFQVELPWGRLFASPTLAGTARSIDALRWVKNNSSAAVNSTDGARDAGEI